MWSKFIFGGNNLDMNDVRNRLIKAVVDNKTKIPYIILNDKNEYSGWTSDFRLDMPDGVRMKLDLHKEQDLFLLFVLASAWSRSGLWENAAYFTAYLKTKHLDEPNFWLDEEFVNGELMKRKESAKEMEGQCTGIDPRQRISFRDDIYGSIVVLANHWNNIKDKLEISNKSNNYKIFIDYISQIEGLGAGNNRMNIKILLILRELRCQNIYTNIPGELCCVPDQRVKNSANNLSICLPKSNSLRGVLKASKIIYNLFGDLYDIPLFAYEDLKDCINL